MNKAELSERLKNACAAVTAAEQELSDIDARFGDADHGLTMSKIAGAISGALEEPRTAYRRCWTARRWP